MSIEATIHTSMGMKSQLVRFHLYCSSGAYANDPTHLSIFWLEWRFPELIHPIYDRYHGGVWGPASMHYKLPRVGIWGILTPQTQVKADASIEIVRFLWLHQSHALMAWAHNMARVR